MDGPTASAPADPGPAVTNVADLVARNAARLPDHPAVVDVTEGRTLSWAQLDAAASVTADRLVGAGIRPGDRVVVRLGNGAAFCVALIGGMRAGAVVVPQGPLAVRRELDIVFADARPAVVVAADDDDMAHAAAAAVDAAVLGPPDTPPPGSASAVLPPTGPTVRAPARPGSGGEDIALLVYTSGTTGTPRGVCLSHRALLANREQCGALRPAPVIPVDRVLLALPLFHVFGLAAGFLQVCWVSATVVLIERFDPVRVAAVLTGERVSALAGVPSMYRAMATLAPDVLHAATAGLRVCTSGGAPLPPEWFAAFHDATGLGIVEGYGLTEGGPVLTSNAFGAPPKPGSVGSALPGVRLRLVDARGRPIDGVARPDTADHRTAAARAAAAADGGPDDGGPDDAAPDDGDTDDGDTDDGDIDDGDTDDDTEDYAHDTGLVAVRGPNLFSGYWPGREGGPDADGWFVTADVGFFDADGDLRLVDRASDLVIVNGFNVYPREVENVLLELAGIGEAAVVGVRDERTGETVKAVLVRAAGPVGSVVTEDDVRAHCVTRLARFKVPSAIVFVEELPRTPTGKVARRQLAGHLSSS